MEAAVKKARRATRQTDRPAFAGRGRRPGRADATVAHHRVANLLKADHIVRGLDWGLAGCGHMMPIERGNELITMPPAPAPALRTV